MRKRARQQARILAVCLSLVLTAGSISPAFAADKKESSASDLSVSKEETVYVMTDQSGAANKIIVSEWLKNTGKLKQVKDSTELADIENVKGDESFDQGSGEGTWKAEGKDIYYQGRIKKELPVEMQISYYLNDKKVSAKEIAGKSGTVKLRFDYTNNQKVNGVYVPFVILTGMSLDNDKFSNVEVTNGKVINDGQKSMIVGYALPGLSESLELGDTDLSIPDHVEVTCQAEKFALDGTMSVATSSLLADLNLGDIHSMDDLKAALDKLQSAAAQLQEGSEKLQSGAGELAKGTGDLSKGTSTLSKGTKDLYKGTKTMKEKVAQLGAGLKAAKDGSADLKAGAQQLQQGAGKLETGSKSLEEGIKTMSGKVDEAIGGLSQTQEGDQKILQGLTELQAAEGQLGLSDGQQAVLNKNIEALKSGLEQNIAGQKAISEGLSEGKSGINQLQSGAEGLAKGSKDLKNGLVDLAGGAGDLNTGITQACQGAGLLEDGAGDLSAGAKKVNNGAGTLDAGAKKVNAGAGQLQTGARDLAGGIAKFKNDGVDKLVKVFDGDVSKLVDRLKALQDAAADYQSFAGKKAETKGTVKFIYKTDEIE